MRPTVRLEAFALGNPLGCAERAEVHLRLWEILAGCLGALFASLVALAGATVVGVALVCAAAVWLVTRIEIVERTAQAGRYARLRGRLGLARLALIFSVYVAIAVAAFSLRGDDAETRPGVIASFSLAGLAFLLLREMTRAGDDAINWLVGARSERITGEALDVLRERGWLVIHGFKKDWGGDIDHIVCGPGGAFAIETKSYGFQRRDRGQVAGNAAWLKGRLGIRWATGVLCVNEQRPPTEDDHIWIVGQVQLVTWLLAQRNTPVNPDEARRALLGG